MLIAFYLNDMPIISTLQEQSSSFSVSRTVQGVVLAVFLMDLPLCFRAGFFYLNSNNKYFLRFPRCNKLYLRHPSFITAYVLRLQVQQILSPLTFPETINTGESHATIGSLKIVFS